MSLPRPTSLWRDADFLKLWAGSTASRFGTLLGALPFLAVVTLEATPVEMGVLGAAGVAPALVVGFGAGVWVDRVRRRPVLIAADVGRALALASIPAAYLLGRVHIEHLYLVAFVNGAFTTFSDVAFRSYVPSLVPRGRLVEANGKLAASEAVVETTAFSVGGWIVQLASALVAVVVDALSYALSALLLLSMRHREPDPSGAPRRFTGEVREGLRAVWRAPLLRALAGAALAEGLAFGVVGAVILLFGVRELGFGAGVLGTFFAVGGLSSLGGAVLAARVTRRFGLGPTMVGGFLLFALSLLLLPLAGGPPVVAAAFLIAQQLGDGAWTAYSINEVSLRQAITPDRMLGRVNASLRVLGVGAALAGSVLGGALGEAAGLRAALAVAAAAALAGALTLAASPVRALRALPAP